MQDLAEFKRAVATDAALSLRLQELAEQIPKGYGSGDDHDRALLEEQRAGKAYDEACEARQASFMAYATHIALLHEERRILNTLGLTANLYRSDSQ